MQLPPANPSRRRILLVQPPFYRLFHEDFSLARYPLTLGYLAGHVRAHTDWDVAIYSADFLPGGQHPTEVSYLTGPGFQRYQENLQHQTGPVWNEIRQVLTDYRPHAIGITAVSQTFTAARHIAALAKQLQPDTKVLLGGPHASIAGSRILAHPEFDVVVRGEGEETLVEVLRAIAGGHSLQGITGTIIRESGQAVEQPARQVLADLDQLVLPYEVARDCLVGFADYSPRAFAYVFASRGCPFHCLFCGSREIWGRKSRLRSPDNVVRELRLLQSLGNRRIHFEDDLFGGTKAGIHALCATIQEGCPGLQWSCELHAKLVDAPTLARMRAAGCHSILLGVESGNNQILERMRKSLTIEEALEACRLIRQHGIELTTFFLVGFPDETEETLADTVRAMRATRSDEIVYSIFTPYPFTEAWELCRARGLIGDDYDMSLYHHQSPANHFTPHIAPERFRALAADIERQVDAWNSQRRWSRKLKRFWRRIVGSGAGAASWRRYTDDATPRAKAA
ncbi:MAG: radical SAM protein [Pirellulales bacterium]